MMNHGISPKVLTTEVSLFENYVANMTEPMGSSFCILDVGHHTTHAYFFHNKKLVSTHTSFIAGNTISETISENYNIDQEEATIYKHQNCFFLTKDQLEKVNDNQKFFANLMDTTIHPLINEIKRWELGFRITHGVQINEVFITGGSSNIKNFNNYLAQELGIPVSYFNSYQNVVTDKIDKEEKQRRKFTISNLEVQCYPRKGKLVNLLNGDFAIQGSLDLPIHSFAYISTRVAAVTALLLMAMIVESFFIGRNMDAADKMIKSLTKNRTLELTNRQKRLALKKPKMLHTKLKKKSRTIKQEVSSLQSAVETNSLSPLLEIGNIIAGTDTEVLQFNAVTMGDFSVVFQSKSVAELRRLRDMLEGSSFNDPIIDLNERKKTLTMNASM
jgi:general secretion pathway protein L